MQYVMAMRRWQPAYIRIKKEGSIYSLNNPEVIPALKALFQLVKSLGRNDKAVNSGIGLVQKEFMDIVFDKESLRIMRGDQKAFDPNNILNSGKIF